MSYRDANLVGQDLSPREREVLNDYHAGLNDSQLAEKYGYSSVNAAGNVRRVAMTKAGEGSKIRQRGSRAPKITPVEEMLRGALDAADATVNSLTERLNEARESATGTPSVLVQNETTRLQDRVTAAQSALDNFTGLDKAGRDEWVKAHREQAQARLSAMENELQDAIAQATAEKDKIAAVAEASGLTL